jgi:hypothetical protein
MPLTLGIEAFNPQGSSGSMVSAGDGCLRRSLGGTWEAWACPTPFFTWVTGEAYKELNFPQDLSNLALNQCTMVDGKLPRNCAEALENRKMVEVRDRFKFLITLTASNGLLTAYQVLGTVLY